MCHPERMEFKCLFFHSHHLYVSIIAMLDGQMEVQGEQFVVEGVTSRRSQTMLANCDISVDGH